MLTRCLGQFALLAEVPLRAFCLAQSLAGLHDGWTARSTTCSVQEICDVAQGTIKKLTDKGFGFIEGERGDIFFHSSSVQGNGYDSLHEGQAVSYTEGNGPKGKRAENVEPVA
jgi:CspA family cold shock protein